MALPNIYMPKNARGFTLLEVLVVLAISSIVLGTTLFFSSAIYRSVAFQAERRALVAVLKQARTDALNSVGGQAHGVALFPDGFNGYVLFVGEHYELSPATSRTYVPVQYQVLTIPLMPATVVFTTRSGTTNFAGEIVLTDATRPLATTSVIINREGYVGW